MQTATEAKRGRMQKPKRQAGNPRPMWGFRPTTEVERYVGAQEEKGAERSAVLVDLLDTQREIREQLGVEWWDVVKVAEAEGVKPGVVIARFVRSGLKKK